MTKALVKFQAKRLTGEKGATMVEYGLLIALIGVLLIGAIGILTGALDALFTEVGNLLG